MPTRERGTAHAPLARESRHQTKHTATTGRGGGCWWTVSAGNATRDPARVPAPGSRLPARCAHFDGPAPPRHCLDCHKPRCPGRAGPAGLAPKPMRQRVVGAEHGIGSASDVRKTRRVHGWSAAHTAPDNHLLAERECRGQCMVGAQQHPSTPPCTHHTLVARPPSSLATSPAVPTAHMRAVQPLEVRALGLPPAASRACNVEVVRRGTGKRKHTRQHTMHNRH